MKTLVVIFFIIISFFVSSCCKGPYPVAGLKVRYLNLTKPSTLKAIRTDRNDLSSVIDTISLGELNSLNSFSALIEFEENSPNFIIFVENTSYIDTVSEIYFERKTKGCRDKVEIKLRTLVSSLTERCEAKPN